MRRILLVMPMLVIGMVVLAPSASAIQDPLKLNIEKPLVKKKSKPVKKQTTPIALAPIVEYIVISGDTLSKVAENHKTTVDRMWRKNTQLTNPDLLNIGDRLVIPGVEEILAERVTAVLAPVINKRPIVPGNGYDYGNCTFYIKTKRPDIGNFWGNADQWGHSARTEGYLVDDNPSVGAIGVAVNYMHVVYIEAVNGDSTVTLSEMNYVSLGVISTRTAPVSEFTYIHY